MNTKEIQELIALFENSHLSKMEVEASDVKLKLEKVAAVELVSAIASAPTAPQMVSVPQPAKSEKKEGFWVKAPIVGTFYQARAKGSTPFVEIGQRVKKGEVLCIIEAMKVMNEIHSPVDGVIAEILVTDESMVEFDQEILRIAEGA